MAGARGVKEVRAALKTLEEEIKKKQRTAIKLAANEYKNDVQEIAPYKTGTYRRSIHVQMKNDTTAIVGTNLPYAKRLEYGFADSDRLGRVYDQPAQPHFRPAMDAGRDRYVQIYEEALF